MKRVEVSNLKKDADPQLDIPLGVIAFEKRLAAFEKRLAARDAAEHSLLDAFEKRLAARDAAAHGQFAEDGERLRSAISKIDVDALKTAIRSAVSDIRHSVGESEGSGCVHLLRGLMTSISDVKEGQMAIIKAIESNTAERLAVLEGVLGLRKGDKA